MVREYNIEDKSFDEIASDYDDDHEELQYVEDDELQYDEDEVDEDGFYPDDDDESDEQLTDDDDEDQASLKSKKKQERAILQHIEHRRQEERRIMQTAIQQSQEQLKDFPQESLHWTKAQASVAPIAMQVGDPQDWVEPNHLQNSPPLDRVKIKPSAGFLQPYDLKQIPVRFGTTSTITVISVLCPDYQNGSCALGKQCTRVHEKATAPNKKIVCKNYPNCPYGDSCKYLHTQQPKLLERERSQAVCKYYPTCKKGDECMFLHIDASPDSSASAAISGASSGPVLNGHPDGTLGGGLKYNHENGNSFNKKHLLCNNVFIITKTKIQPTVGGFCKFGDKCYYAHCLQDVKDEIVKESFKCMHKECKGVELISKLVEKDKKQIKKIKYINVENSQFICLKAHPKENPNNFILRTAEAREKLKARKAAQNGTGYQNLQQQPAAAGDATLLKHQGGPKRVQKRQKAVPCGGREVHPVK